MFAATSFGPALHFIEANSGPKFGWPGPEVLNSAGKPFSAATFDCNIFTAGGTVLLVAGILTAAVHRSSVRRAFISLPGVVVQFKWTTLTVVVVLALAYVMNYPRRPSPSAWHSPPPWSALKAGRVNCSGKVVVSALVL